MASIGPVAIDGDDGSFPTGVGFWLKTKSSFSRRLSPVAGWEVELMAESDVIVARSKSVLAMTEAVERGREAIEVALDQICFQLNDPLDLKPEPRDYAVVTRGNGERILTFWTEVPFRLRVSPVKVTVVDKDGNERPVEKVEPEWMPALRYYRISQTRDDVFDAYRHMYLAFEAILQSRWPKTPNERETPWLERAVGELGKQIDLSRYTPPRGQPTLFALS